MSDASAISAGLPMYQPTMSDVQGDVATIKTAQDFEALMINNVLQEMRRTVSFSGEPEFANSTFYAMFDEQISRALAEQGGFGLAESVKKEIEDPTNSLK